jgi:hypothetical protein
VAAGPAAIGETPLGATPLAEPNGATLDELSTEHIRPLLHQIRDEYRNQLNGSRLRIKGLDAQAQGEVGKYLNQVGSDMASTKYAAMGYGEQMRDASLLNYTKRYGFDNILGMAAPYQFWYTRSMMNWAKKMVDRPSWFAMYARYQEMQEKLKRNMPTRLKGKMRLAAPWLPEWAGGGIWNDPLSKIFPFAQFGQPFERYAADANMIDKRAEQVLMDMAEAETITEAERKQALASKDGPVWQQARTQAAAELDKNESPASLVTTMMQPSLWWTAIDAIASGKPEKLSPLPITRTAQALRTATEGTALAPIGRIGGLLAAPEEAARKKAGLSQYGEWGAYYIDRTLSNMAADGTITAADARRVMIERNPQDPIWLEAQQRVQYEQMLRVPGAATLNQIASGNLAGVIQSLPTLLFPGGLFPTGELKQRGLKTEYDLAWKKLKAGDESALRTFFDNNPEYEARTALYAQPEERLQQFMVNEIWDRYYQLEAPNRSQARKALGQKFEDAFMNPETRSYDSIPVETMALWTRILNGMLPRTPETEPIAGMPAEMIPQPEYYSPDVSAGIQEYQAQRAQQFPNYYALQEQYYQLEKGSPRRSFLARFPQLKQYWEWKKGYQAEHPELAPYFDQGASAADEKPASPAELQAVTEPLSRSILVYLIGGGTLTSGAKAELNRLASSAGRSITPEEYARLLLAGMVAPQQ